MRAVSCRVAAHETDSLDDCAGDVGEAVLAADKKPLTKEESAKVIEAVIRDDLGKPTGELTKADLEKVTGDMDLYDFQLTSVKGLEKLTKLDQLFLNANQLTNVTGLEKLTKLTILDLSNNQLTNVKRLENLTQLRSLHLSANQLTSVKGLEKLVHLTELRLGNNPDLTKAQIDELRKALPKCFITSNPKK